ncbi:MAG: sugar ABC transporter substrate-binding protein [Puniceicoccaceae bacterium]|nr:MAG: sugar ABC transporter substrate-binding protein [Puniceicoccaceae bacterium]
MHPRIFIFILLLIASLASAQNREILGEYKLGIVGRDTSDIIYQAAHEGAKAAALDLSNQYSIDVELLIYTPDQDQGSTQSTSLAELFIQNADGLIISPGNTESVRSSVQFAIEQGQAVVYFERQLPGIEPLAAILADELEAGRMAGRAILPKLPTRGRVAILTSHSPTPALEQRLAGLREVLGFRRIETIVACEPNYRSAIETLQAAEEADRNDQIRAWVFLEDWPLLGMPALPWRSGQRPVVAIQSSPSAFMYVDQGYLDALIVHPYYDWGYQSVTTLIEKLHRDQSPETPTQLTTPRVVDWRNTEEYRQNWQRWLR